MKQHIITAIVSLTVFSFSSCTNWLGLQPEDGVIRQDFWKTKEEAESVLMGCYAQMMDDDMMLSYLLWGEMRAEFVMPSARANSDIIAIRDGEIVPSNEFVQWDKFYRVINQCNTVIELAPLVQKEDLSFSDELLKQYIAEATSIRSLMYFYLVRTFRDVPYITVASIYDDQDFSPSKMSQADILTHLIDDLTKVEADLPYSYNNTVETKGRFTKWGLKALLADIYLWHEDYSNARDLCTQIIESGQYSLIPIKRTTTTALDENGQTVPVYIADKNDINVLFDKMYVKGNSIESILELQFDTEKSSPLVQWLKPVSGKLQAKTEEIRGFFNGSALSREWRDIRTEYSWKSESVWKWIGLSADGATYRPDNESFSNWIFYRLADVILMKAEAETEMAMQQGDDQTLLKDAFSLVKQIRDRANATDGTSYAENYGSETENLDSRSMEEFILDERAREFAFEGKRWFDLVKHAERDNSRNIYYLARLAVRSTIPEKVSILQNKWINNPGSHYLPIYTDEIRMNKNLIQNEFYK